jgi:hypothetical protein
MSTPTEVTSSDPGTTLGNPISPPRPLTPIKEHEDTNGSQVVAKSETGDICHASVTFNPDWDTVMQLQGKSGIVQFKVASSNVAAASPVWRNTFYADSAIVRPSKETLALELEDNVEALETLFRIVHYEFSKVPKKLSLDELYQVTRLTSKYQCTQLVYPWACKWISPLATYLSNEDCPTGNHKAAWIAWELGDVKLLRDMLDSIIVTAEVDSDGELINQAGTKLKDLILPSGSLGKLLYFHIHIRSLNMFSTNSLTPRSYHGHPSRNH